MFLQLMVVCLSGVGGGNVINYVSAVNSVATGHAPIQHQGVVANHVTQLLPQLKKRNATRAQVNTLHSITERTDENLSIRSLCTIYKQLTCIVLHMCHLNFFSP